MHFLWFICLQVLFLVDPIDEVAVQNLKSYKEKDFVDISKEDLDLGWFIETLIWYFKKEISISCPSYFFHLDMSRKI